MTDRSTSPGQWLENLKELGFWWLLEKHGYSMAGAAYEYACVQNAARGYTAPTPTRADIVAAARHIANKCGVKVDPELRHCLSSNNDPDF